MKLSFTEKKHGWIEDITQEGVIYKMPADGLIIVFDAVDVEELLNKHYPKAECDFSGSQVWFFENRDREIAEKRGTEIYCNPQVLWRHFKTEATV